MLESYGIKRRPMSTKNPQANAIIKRMYQTLGKMLRTFQLSGESFDKENP